MKKELFMKIMHVVREYDIKFAMKKDTIRMPRFSSIYKCTVAMRMLAYEAPAYYG
jgi:hypothetical protein